jgi:hypothetical protein
MYNLFLDDIRTPKEAFLYREGKTLCGYSDIPNGCWEIVRNYEDFVKILNEKGLPRAVSFDCDLCEDHMVHYMKETTRSEIYEWENFDTKCGIHCANYLKSLLKGGENIKIYVHTANQVGRQIIKQILSC